MCRTTVGRVLAIEHGAARGDLVCLHRRALSLLVPAPAPGDLVLVGLGTVLGRVDPDDRDALDHIHQAAGTAPPPLDLTAP